MGVVGLRFSEVPFNMFFKIHNIIVLKKKKTRFAATVWPYDRVCVISSPDIFFLPVFSALAFLRRVAHERAASAVTSVVLVECTMHVMTALGF